MPSRRSERGSALVMALIVVLVITAVGVAVIRFASREVAGAHAVRKEASVAACADAARQLLMARWKLLGAHGLEVGPLDVSLLDDAQTRLQGGHYGDDPTASAYWDKTSGQWIKNIQVVKLHPLTVGSSYVVSDLTNRIGDQLQLFGVVVHCTQADGRQAEVEFAVQYGL